MIWAAADAPNPVQSSLTGDVIHNADGSNTVVITGGHWNWLSHSSDCNLDRYAAGFAADWNDPNDPGYPVANGIDVGSTKTGDNLVHWNTSGPRCGTFDWIVNGKPHPQGDIQSGLLRHTYAAGTAIGPVCLVSYDVHGSTTPKDPIAGGSGHNGDNSIEKNNDVANGPGCFNIPLPKPQDLAITKTVLPSSVQVGQNFTYGLTVSNAGQVASSGLISVTDNVPATLQVLSIGTAGDGWNCPAAVNNFTCTRSDSIAVGGSAPQIVVVAKALASAVPAGQQSGTVTNTGTVTNANDSNSANNQSTVTSTVVAPPPPTLDLGIVKQAQVASAKVGDPLGYTLTVRNGSTEDTTGVVTVTDTVPNGLRLDGASGNGWTCNTSGSSLTCTRPSLAHGTTAPVINVSTTVLSSAVPAGQNSSNVTNTGVVSTPGDTDASNNQSSVTTPISTVPQAPLDLAIVKIPSASSAKVGDQLGYTLQVTNVSAADTTGTVTVTDSVPSSLQLLSAGGTGWNCSNVGQAITCTRASLAAGASASISINSIVLSAAVPSVTNTGVVSTPGDTVPGNNTSTVTTPVTPAPNLDVAIVKSASASSAKLGDTLTYTLNVINTSTVPTTGAVTVTDNVPAGLSLQSVSGTGWTCSNVAQAISCTLPSLAAGASAAPITVTTTVLSTGAPQVVNTGIVSTPGDSNPNNNQSTVTTPVTVPAPKLAIVKSAVPASGTAVHRGDEITYTLSYSNDSDTAAPGASITDDVPAGTTLDTAATCSNCTVSGNTLNWSVNVPAHGSGSVSFSVIVNDDVADGAVIRNHAVMSFGGTPTTTNETQHPVSVPSGALSLVKSVDNTAPSFGDLLTYSLVVSATGNVTQTGVTVTDVVPNDTTYEGPITCSTGCLGEYNAGTNTVTWSVGTLAPGSPVTLTFATRINTPNVPQGTTVTRTIDNVGLVFSNETPTTPSNHVRTPITAVLGVKIVKTPSNTPTATLPFTGVGLPVGRAVTDGVLLVLAGMLMLALASGGRRKPNAA